MHVVALDYDAGYGVVFLVLEVAHVSLRMVPRMDQPISVISPLARLDLIHADCLTSTDKEFWEGLVIRPVVLGGYDIAPVPVQIDQSLDPAMAVEPGSEITGRGWRSL